jgi:5-methylcytosine-specific restriction endonuclease McrA
MAMMPWLLTDKQKDFIHENAHQGGSWLADQLRVDRAAIYQYAHIAKISVKKGGRGHPEDSNIRKMVNACRPWPRPYRQYKKLLVERDGLRCHYCDVVMNYAEAQIDHIIAKARGGTDAPSNLVLACIRCNHVKSTLCYTCPEFRDAIVKRS